MRNANHQCLLRNRHSDVLARACAAALPCTDALYAEFEAEIDIQTLEVTPAAPWRVTSAVVMPGFQLDVSFVDGTRGIADLSAVIQNDNPGIFADLADPDIFARAHVHLGVITWPNGADLDPDWLQEETALCDIWRL